MTNQNKGKIIQIVGPVVDVEFGAGAMPALYEALILKNHEGVEIVLEVAKHLGFGKVRAISLASTDGLTRGLEVTSTGAPISVPVGKEVLGGLFNVLGKAINAEKKGVKFDKLWPIHRKAPDFTELSTKT